MIESNKLMAKTKRTVKKQREKFRLLSLCIGFLAFLLVFFEFVLTMHGGWDDLSYRVIFAAPLVAAVSLIFAIINIVKYRAKGYEIIPPLSMVAVSSLFFCYVMVYVSVKSIG